MTSRKEMLKYFLSISKSTNHLEEDDMKNNSNKVNIKDIYYKNTVKKAVKRWMNSNMEKEFVADFITSAVENKLTDESIESNIQYCTEEWLLKNIDSCIENTTKEWLRDNLEQFVTEVVENECQDWTDNNIESSVIDSSESWLSDNIDDYVGEPCREWLDSNVSDNVSQNCEEWVDNNLPNQVDDAIRYWIDENSELILNKIIDFKFATSFLPNEQLAEIKNIEQNEDEWQPLLCLPFNKHDIASIFASAYWTPEYKYKSNQFETIVKDLIFDLPKDLGDKLYQLFEIESFDQKTKTEDAT